MAGTPLRIVMLLTEQEPNLCSGLCEEGGMNGVLSPFSGVEPAEQGLPTVTQGTMGPYAESVCGLPPSSRKAPGLHRHCETYHQ